MSSIQKLSLLPLLALLMLAGPGSADIHPLVESRIVELTVDDTELLQLVLDEGLRPLACRPGPGTSRWLVTDDQLELVGKIGMPVRLIIRDVPAHIEEEQQVNMQARGLDWYASYHTWEEMNERLNQLEAGNPDLVHGFVVGLTHENREIQGVRIGTGLEGTKPAILFNACQHAREWVSPMVPLFIADELVAGYGTDDQITALVELVDVYVVPVTNPDGYVYTYVNGGDRYWRKNRRHNGSGECQGVDLNRNWDIDWNGEESTSENFCSDVYVGPSAFSEPETSAMRDFVLSLNHLKAHIDFHSYQQVILQNWGYTNTPPPDQEAIDDLGGRMSNAISSIHGENYPHGGGDDLLYLASGIFPDWTYSATNAFGYTIELRPSSSNPGFELPPDQIRPTAEENFAAALAMIEWAGISVQFSYTDGRPEWLWTDGPTNFNVELQPSGANPTAAVLFWRLDGGEYNTTPLQFLGGTTWQATLPAADCNHQPEYYIQVQTDDGNTIKNPLLAPDYVYTTGVYSGVEIALEDDGESDQGWIVSGNASDGQWQRGIPADGQRSDPPSDSDGSGSCWITDNVAGNSDVDGGQTILTSSQLDISAGGFTLSYDRWYANDFGASPNADTFVIEVTDDGTDWIVLEVVGPTGNGTSGGWISVNFQLDDVTGLEPGNQFQIRFTASDLGEGSVIEAGVDAIRLAKTECVSVDCDADCAGDDGQVNIKDLLAVIAAWSTSGGPCDIDGNGTVDIADLLAVIASWGPCPDGE